MHSRQIASFSKLIIQLIFCIILSIILSFSVIATAPEPEKLITLHFRDTPLQIILQAIADNQQLNILIADDIKGNYSLKLEQVSWQNAVNALAELANIKIIISHNIMLVFSNNRFNARHQQVQETEKQSLKTLHYQLTYASADNLVEQIRNKHAQLLTEKGQLIVDNITNSLIIYEKDESINLFKKLLPILDKPIQQIQLTAHIVNMNNNNVRQLGVNWSTRNATNANKWRLNEFNVSLPIANPTVTTSFQLAKLNSHFIDLELSALEAENNVEIIASPRLLTLDKQTASIKQGMEIPYESAKTDSTAATIEFKDAVLSLEVTPHILPGNKVELWLLITQNSPGRSFTRQNSSEILAIDTQEIKTKVIVEHNQTLILGGIFQHSTNQSTEHVPFLGRLPLLGQLFSRTSKRLEKRQLLIFITPEIIQS